MATNVIEVFLKFRKEGDEFIRQTSDSLGQLKKQIADVTGIQMSGDFVTPIYEALRKAGLSADDAKKHIDDLKAATKDPLSSAYAMGVVEALNSTDKAALKAKLSVASVQEELAKGGSKSAAILGMMDALGLTSQAADKAKERIAALNNVNLNGVRDALKAVGDAATGVGSGGAGGGSGGLTGFAGVFKSIEAGALSLTGVVKGLVGAFLGLEVVGYLKDAANAAARTQVLGTVLHQVGQTAGYTKEELDKADSSVQKMGITASASREALASLINTGLNINLAAPLARAAQDLAVIAGWNSSETFQRMLINISQLDTMGMRWMGITVDRVRAEATYARQLGITADALSAKQQKEAFANAVLEEATKRQGIYEASMNDVAKQTASLARYKENLAVAIGNKLLPAYLELVKQFTKFLDESEKTASSMDKNGESAKSFGEKVGVVAFILRNAVTDIIDHAGAILGLVAAYRTFGALVSAGAGAGAIAGLVAMWGTFTVAVTNAVAVMASWGIASGAMSASAGVAAASIGAMVAPIALVVAALASMYAIMRAGQEFWKMSEALKNLEEFQKKLKDKMKNIPEDAQEAWKSWEKISSGAVGQSRAEIQAQMNEIVKAIKAGGAEYTLAMSKMDPRNMGIFERWIGGLMGVQFMTEKEMELVDGWQGKVAALTQQQERLAEVMKSMATPVEDPASQRYAQARAEAAELAATYKNAAEAAKAFGQQMAEAVTHSYDLANQGAKYNYEVARSYLEATEQYKGQHLSKMVSLDTEYYQTALRLTREEFDFKKSITEATRAMEEAALRDIINLRAKDDPKAAEDAQRQLLQSKQRYLEEDYRAEQSQLQRLQGLRDDAHNKYIAQLRELQSIKTQIDNEMLSHELRIAELQLRSGDDRLRSREEALRDRERALADQERAAQAMGDKNASERFRGERDSIAREREQLARDRESQEKQIEAMASQKFNEYLAKAREELAKGKEANLDLVKEYEQAAGVFGRYAKSNAEQQREENELYKVKMERLQQAADIAKAAADQEQQNWNNVNEAVKSLTVTMENLITKMMEMSMKNQQFMNTAQMEQAVAKMEELNVARKKALENGNQALADSNLKEIEELAKKVQAWSNANAKLQQEFDKISAEQKAKIDTSDVDRAQQKFKEAGEQAEKTYDQIKRGATGKLDVDSESALRKMRQTREEMGRTGRMVIDVDANTDNARNKSQQVKGDIERNKPKPWSIEITDLATGKARQINQDVQDTLKPGEIKITPSTEQAEEAIDSLRGKLIALESPVDPQVDVDTSGAEAALDSVQNRLNGLSGDQVEVQATIEPDTTQIQQATQQIDNEVVTPTAVFEADDSRVWDAKNQAQQPTYSYHTIYVQRVETNALGGLIGHLAEGGPARQPPGLISGFGTGTSDSIFSMLGNGEFVLRSAAVSHYGLDFLNDLNQLLMPPVRAFANGGPTSDQYVRRVAAANSPASNDAQAQRDEMDLHFNIGSKRHTVRTSRQTANDLAGALRELSRAG